MPRWTQVCSLPPLNLPAVATTDSKPEARSAAQPAVSYLAHHQHAIVQARAAQHFLGVARQLFQGRHGAVRLDQLDP